MPQPVIALISFPAMIPPLSNGFRQGVALLAYLLVLIWALAMVDLLTGRRLWRHLGIQPRRLVGLPGILIAPLLHQDFRHTAANSAPLVILGSLILVLQGLEVFGLVTGICWILSGVGIWLLGRKGTIHLGASGLVFGYLGYLLFRGYFEGSMPAVSVAILVGLLYGGSLWGLLPLQPGKSWVGHGAGFLAGAWVAHNLDFLQSWWMQNSGW